MSKLILGCDPEFVATSGNRRVSASSFCSGNYDNCDTDAFGADGCGRIFELRPEPSAEPLEIVANIHDIFTSQLLNKKSIKAHDWFAGSYKCSNALGGHIHFGSLQFRRACHKYSEFLAQHLAPVLMLVEDTSQGRDRRASGYGGMMDYRTPAHGLEYRNPSSWITSPYIAAATLCLAKVVGEYMLSTKDSLKGKKYVDERDFRYMDKTKVRKAFPELWAEITKMPLYPKYKEYIDIFEYLITNKLTWFPKQSMKEAWGLTRPHSMNVEKIAINSIWQGI